MSKSIAELTAEALSKVESQERPAAPAVETRSYDPTMADAIRDAVLELYGGDAEWAMNFKAIENGGKNAKGEPGVLGAIKTERFSPQHPKALVLYNGNRGPNAVFSGFSAEEVDAVYAQASA